MSFYAVLCWLSGDRLDASRFQSPGINYKGKLIGLEDVPGPRGDMMCQVAMAKVKAAVKTIGEHKLKIVLNISLDGIRIFEEKSAVSDWLLIFKFYVLANFQCSFS